MNEKQNSDQRPGWDEYFMNIAHVVKTRGNCLRRQVAAVIVRDSMVISTGYNGTPRGITNCFDGGCPRCASDIESGQGLDECICSHAEANAITQAARHGITLYDSSMYVTVSPCLGCARQIINAGIREVVYEDEYHFNEQTRMMLNDAGVTFRQLNL